MIDTPGIEVPPAIAPVEAVPSVMPSSSPAGMEAALNNLAGTGVTVTPPEAPSVETPLPSVDRSTRLTQVAPALRGEMRETLKALAQVSMVAMMRTKVS